MDALISAPALRHTLPAPTGIQPLRQNQPIFNVPASVVIVIAVMVAIHVARQFLPETTDAWFLWSMAFVPSRYTYSPIQFDIPGGDIAAFSSFITHMLVHGDITHLLFNAAWFLACGGAIALRIGTLRFLAFTAFTGFAGALAFLILNFGQPIPMVGASGAISGMMAGLLRFLFSAIDQGDVAALRYAPRSIRLTPLTEALTDRRILAVTAIWVFINALTAFGFGGAQDAGAIAWEAHLGGFLAGLFFFGVFDLPRRQSPQLFH